MADFDELIGHLGAALMQTIPSDDQIIMDHVREAERIAKELRKSHSRSSAGCGDPNCRDPNCEYGKGPLRCQSCGAILPTGPQGAVK